MKVFDSVEDIRKIRWADPTLSWGMFPTLGGIHDGHLELIRRARKENDCVGVSVFLNPTQFAQTEDLDKYPKQMEQDLALLEAEGVDLVWTPLPSDVYPNNFETYVDVEQLSTKLEGASRPGHFRGVSTVVNIIFNVFQPNRVYFGQKDAQQVAVLKRMIRDLKMNIEFVTCPTVRESDGLAMSTRNQYLNPDQSQAALVLYRALTTAESLFNQGERDAKMLKQAMESTIASEPLTKLDYVSVADPDSLDELDGHVERALLSGAIFLDQTRLIDNLIVG
jgi:pantoate--beta-alanine ligase